MDIWRWVNEYAKELEARGNTRLEELITLIPDATCDDRHGEVDALVPEALALARAEKHPWAELFVRHWSLQSRVLHRHEVKDNLPEAVSLLEFASRPNARDCPQSVCVTQDLAACYADKDGPGYVEERLAVARETLARIDPHWPCFDCISSEYVDALLDDGRPEAALAFIDEQREKLSAIGELELGSNLLRDRADVLLELGHAEAALKHLELWDDARHGAHGRLEKRLLMVRALVGSADLERARAEWPGFSAIEQTPALYHKWLQASLSMLAAGALENDWRFGRAIWLLGSRLSNNGALYFASSFAVEAAALAVRRGARHVASLCLQCAEERVALLRRPERLRERLAALRAELAGMAAPELRLSETPAALAEQLSQNPEQDLELVRHARERWPTDESLVLLESRALRATGFAELSERVLGAHLALHPDALTLLNELGTLLIDGARHDELGKLLSALPEQSGEPLVMKLWLGARSAMADGRDDQARALLDQLLDVKPSSIGGRALLASSFAKAGEHARALTLFDALVEEVEPGALDWDRMVSATLLGEWTKVRDSAERLGMRFEGQGPIQESMGLCRLCFREPPAAKTSYFAERTGPVSARVIEIAGPDGLERYGDEVVFEPTPLNPERPSDDANEYVAIYPVVQLVKPGGCHSYVLDGPNPGEIELAALAEGLGELGAALQVRSHDDYELPGANAQSLPGVYALIAVPAHVAPRELHDVLRARTAHWPHPVVWPGLAAALGHAEEIRRQDELIARYGL